MGHSFKGGKDPQKITSQLLTFVPNICIPNRFYILEYAVRVDTQIQTSLNSTPGFFFGKTNFQLRLLEMVWNKFCSCFPFQVVILLLSPNLVISFLSPTTLAKASKVQKTTHQCTQDTMLLRLLPFKFDFDLLVHHRRILSETLLQY